MPRSITTFLREFRDRESGVVSVEFTMWLPVYVAILTLTVDASYLFLGQAGMWNAAHDISRQMSIGIMNETEGETYAAEKLAPWTGNHTTNINLTTTTVEVEITTAASDLAPFGFWGLAETFDVKAKTIHYLEPGSALPAATNS